MCLIIDNCVASLCLVAKPTADFAPVRQALFNGKATMHYGGKLSDEYAANHEVRRIVAQLDKAGRAKVVPISEIESTSKVIQNRGLCRSNDIHIISIAILSKTRLLCTHDEALKQDFKDKRIISPKGRIYQSVQHRRLLQMCCKKVA